MRHRFLAVSMCVLFAAAPPAAHAQSAPDPANDPALLQLFGLQNAYVVDGKSKPLTAIADEQAARVEAERAAAAAAAPPPPPAATSAPTVPEAAGTVWNFVRRFVSVCGSGWRSKQHACYADVTSRTPQHWNSPPTAASPEPVGFLDSDATPPPLRSVKTPGAVHPAQIVLTDQIAALAMTTSPRSPSARASHRRSFNPPAIPRRTARVHRARFHSA